MERPAGLFPLIWWLKAFLGFHNTPGSCNSKPRWDQHIAAGKVTLFVPSCRFEAEVLRVQYPASIEAQPLLSSQYVFYQLCHCCCFPKRKFESEMVFFFVCAFFTAVSLTMRSHTYLLKIGIFLFMFSFPGFLFFYLESGCINKIRKNNWYVGMLRIYWPHKNVTSFLGLYWRKPHPLVVTTI